MSPASVQTELVPCSDEAVRRAADLLAAGEIVAFPTETVYGLGARADRAAAIRRIYAAKGRPQSVPLIVHVAGLAAAKPFAADWPATADALVARFWPGPLTLVVRRAAQVLPELTAGRSTVALRAPAHRIAQQLLALCPFAIAAPSANLFGEPPPLSGQDVLRGLAGRVPLIVDAGSVARADAARPAPSTIVDLTQAPPTVLREGALSRAELERVVALR